ncbi:hypothetical protein [Streptomyces malaysiensis]
MAIRTTYQGGSRFYVNPATKVKYPGVTSVIGMIPKQDFLAPWNAKMAAERAVDSLPFIQQMVATAGRDAAVEYIKGAARAYTKVRSDIGSNAHDMFERMIRGEGGLTERDANGDFLVPVHPDMVDYRANFAEFLAVVKPQFAGAEDIAWSERHEYAGSFDIIMVVMLSLDAFGRLRVDHENGTPHLLLGDWKTSAKTYTDVALQLAAYRYADYIVDADGNRRDMPEFDGACVLHITPDAWEFIPVVTDEEVFSYFLSLRKTFRWVKEVSKTVLGTPLAKGGKLVSGTQRRG